jgi:hypothetical protein
MSYVLVLGLGLGYHLIELLERAGGGPTILVVENSTAVFRASLRASDLGRVLASDRVVLSVGESPEEVYARWNLIFRFVGVKGVEIVELPSIVKLNPTYYRQVRELVASNIKLKYSNTATVMNLSHSWQMNTLANIVEVIKSRPVKSLFGRLKGIPAIIVASGPSLDGNVRTLSEAKGKALIVALGSAMKPLISRGVKPDVVVAIDASSTNYEHFAGAETQGLSLLAEPMVHPRVLEEFHGRVFMTSFDNPVMRWLKPYVGDKGVSQMGGTVAITALDALRKFGCSPIILVGQDLSFPGGRTHARGSSWDAKALEGVNKFYSVEAMHHDYIRRNVSSRQDVMGAYDLYGNRLSTHRNLAVYKELLEAYVAYNCRPDEVIVNSTQGGLAIKGLADMPLSEAIKRFCKEPLNLSPIVEGDATCPAGANIDGLLPAMRELIVGLRETEEVCLRGAEVSERLQDALKGDGKIDGSAGALMGQLDEIDREIKGKSQAVEMLEEITQRVLFRVMQGVKSSADLDGQAKGMELAKQCRELYVGIWEACREMRGLFERAMGKVANFLEEENYPMDGHGRADNSTCELIADN